MLFNWKKNEKKEKNFINKDNNSLIKELKEKGITDKNILNAIKKVPRKIFVDKLFLEKAFVLFALVFVIIDIEA